MPFNATKICATQKNNDHANRLRGRSISVIPSERSERGTAAIKPRAESSLFELCRGVAVKTEGQSPLLFFLIKKWEIATVA